MSVCSESLAKWKPDPRWLTALRVLCGKILVVTALLYPHLSVAGPGLLLKGAFKTVDEIGVTHRSSGKSGWRHLGLTAQ